MARRLRKTVNSLDTVIQIVENLRRSWFLQRDVAGDYLFEYHEDDPIWDFNPALFSVFNQVKPIQKKTSVNVHYGYLPSIRPGGRPEYDYTPGSRYDTDQPLSLSGLGMQVIGAIFGTSNLLTSWGSHAEDHGLGQSIPGGPRFFFR